jgi:ATPase subunit of ABC transporter with duplicated ATPase domains
MPAIILSNLCWSTPDGKPILSGFDFRFTAERIGLIGRNGVGKSTLLALIAGERLPAAGHVRIDGSFATLRQTPQADPGQSIADLFDVRAALAQLDKAEAGDATMEELETCDWTLSARLADALAEVGLAADPATPLAQLSGGQRTRAALAAVVFARPDWVLLDEPTNHLDTEGRVALAALLQRWRGGAIVVSHDRALLEGMDAIAELTSLGIARYGGNWSAYRARKDIELAAARHALDHAEREAATLARKTQIATERQQRRDSAGARQAARGDMPRILLGRRKEQAERSGGDAARRADRQRTAAEGAIADARAKIEILAPLSIALPSAQVPAGARCWCWTVSLPVMILRTRRCVTCGCVSSARNGSPSRAPMARASRPCFIWSLARSRRYRAGFTARWPRRCSIRTPACSTRAPPSPTISPGCIPAQPATRSMPHSPGSASAPIWRCNGWRH